MTAKQPLSDTSLWLGAELVTLLARKAIDIGKSLPVCWRLPGLKLCKTPDCRV